MRYEKNNFEKTIIESETLSDVARKLGLEPSKGNRDTIKKYIKLYGIDTNHFKYKKINSSNKKILLENILIKNSTYNRTDLKRRLLKEGLKYKICEECGQDENWRSKKISLILDHINGINDDNRLENLRILCPNCNATLDTNCGKNRKEISLPNFNYKEYNFCIDCNVVISKQSKRCVKCDHIKQQKCERPDYDVLIKEIEIMGYVKTGKKYGVSDNAIRKWINSYI